MEQETRINKIELIDNILNESAESLVFNELKVRTRIAEYNQIYASLTDDERSGLQTERLKNKVETQVGRVTTADVRFLRANLSGAEKTARLQAIGEEICSSFARVVSKGGQIAHSQEIIGLLDPSSPLHQELHDIVSNVLHEERLMPWLSEKLVKNPGVESNESLGIKPFKTVASENGGVALDKSNTQPDSDNLTISPVNEVASNDPIVQAIPTLKTPLSTETTGSADTNVDEQLMSQESLIGNDDVLVEAVEGNDPSLIPGARPVSETMQAQAQQVGNVETDVHKLEISDEAIAQNIQTLDGFGDAGAFPNFDAMIDGKAEPVVAKDEISNPVAAPIVIPQAEASNTIILPQTESVIQPVAEPTVGDSKQPEVITGNSLIPDQALSENIKPVEDSIQTVQAAEIAPVVEAQEIPPVSSEETPVISQEVATPPESDQVVEPKVDVVAEVQDDGSFLPGGETAVESTSAPVNTAATPNKTVAEGGASNQSLFESFLHFREPKANNIPKPKWAQPDKKAA